MRGAFEGFVCRKTKHLFESWSIQVSTARTKNRKQVVSILRVDQLPMDKMGMER